LQYPEEILNFEIVSKELSLENWDSRNPCVQRIDDFFYLTMVYYAGLAIAAVAIIF